MKSVLTYKPKEHNLVHAHETTNNQNILFVENMDFEEPDANPFGPEHIILDYPIPGAYTTFVLPKIEWSKDGELFVLGAEYTSLDGQHKLCVINADNMENDE